MYKTRPTNSGVLLCLLMLTAVLTSASTKVLAEPLTAREIMVKNEAARKADISEVAELQMTLVNHQGRERVRRVSFILDDTDPLLRKSYLRFIAPQNVEGIAFVQLEHADADNDRWLYLPSQRRTRRISGSTKTDSFVGTDFSFEDFEILDGMVGGKHREYRLLREEIREGEDCWVIEALPATDEERAITGYGKRVIWVAKSHYHAVYTEFYDHQEELFKVMTADQFALVPGGAVAEVRPHRLIMETLKTGHRTVIKFKDFVLNEPLDTRMFTREYLSRG